MKKILNKRLIILGIITIFFVVLMTSFSFPDLFAMFYVPDMIGKGNIYTLVKLNKSICPWLDATWPPFYYLTIGSYLKFLQFFKIIPSSIFSVNQCPIWELILNKNFLFWTKLPFLILHFLSAIFFSKFFNKSRFLWFLLWLLNPIIIFITFIQGQFDIIPTFFILTSLYYAKKGNIFISAFLLGLGGAFKHYPFLLALPFLIILTRTFFDKLKFIIILLTPYLISIIPFYNNDFLKIFLFSENYKMLSAGLSIGNFKISFYIVLYGLLLGKLLLEKKKDFNCILKYGFLFSSLYFFTSFWFVQRYLFLVPFLLLNASVSKKIFNSLPWLYFSYFIYTLFMFPGLFDHTLLRPISSSILTIEYNNLFYFNDITKSIIFFIISSFLIWISYLTIRRSSNNKIFSIKKKDILIHSLPLFFYLSLILILFFINLSKTG